MTQPDPVVSRPFKAAAPTTAPDADTDIDDAAGDAIHAKRANKSVLRYVTIGLALMAVVLGVSYVAKITSVNAPKAVAPMAASAAPDSVSDRIAHIEAWSRETVAPRSQEMVNNINFLKGEVAKLKAEVAALKQARPIAQPRLFGINISTAYLIGLAVLIIVGMLFVKYGFPPIMRRLRRPKTQD